MKIRLLFLFLFLLNNFYFVSFVVAREIKVRSGQSLQKAADILKPGDILTIYPGIYFDRISVPCDDVVIRAAAPGVVLDGAGFYNKKDFKASKVPGVYVFSLAKDAALGTYRHHEIIPWVWLGDILMLGKTSPLKTSDKMCYYVNGSKRQLEVNINGRFFPEKARIIIPIRKSLIYCSKKNVKIRGLKLRRSGYFAIDARSSNNTKIEFCDIKWCGGGIWGGGKSHIKANSIKFCNASGVQNESYSLLEENIVVATRIGWDNRLRWAGTMKTNAVSYSTWRQNWIMDEFGGGVVKVKGNKSVRQWKFTSGLWPDINCYNNTYSNNSIARLGHAGIYIEHTSDKNVVSYNAVQDCAMGITVRQGSYNLISKNWIFDRKALGWGKVNTDSYCSWGKGYEKDGRKITKFENHPMWGHQYLEGLCLWHAYGYPEYSYSRNNVFTQNLVQVSGRAISVPFAKEMPKELAKKKFGLSEKNLSIVQASPGKIWVSDSFPKRREKLNLPFSNLFENNYYIKKNKNFAYLGNKQIDSFQEYKKLSGWDNKSFVGKKYTPKILGLEAIWTISSHTLKPNIPVAILHDPSFETQSTHNFNLPLFWRATNPRMYVTTPPSSFWIAGFNQKSMGYNNSLCLVVNGTRGNNFVGWKSAYIPVRENLKFEINFLLKCENIKAAEKIFGVVAFCKFFDSCGFETGQSQIIKPINESNFDFKRIAGKIKTSANSSFMQIHLGTINASGSAYFDEFHINLL